MFASRRKFASGLLALATGCLTGVAAGVSPIPRRFPLLIGPPDSGNLTDLKFGYCSITWGQDVVQAIKDIASLGYRGIQTTNVIRTAFPDPVRAKEFFAAQHLRLVAMSGTQISLDPSQRQTTLDQGIDNAHYILAAGGEYLQVTGSKGDALSPDDYKRQGELLTQLGEQVSKIGLQVGLHNHMGTITQSPQALDVVLSASDPHFVKLLLDVGHYYLGGGDPALAIHKYHERLLFLHLKDTSANPGASDREWVELGRGNVDFKAIFKALRQTDFRGWGLVELDAVPKGSNRTPKQSALISEQYLVDVLHLAV